MILRIKNSKFFMFALIALSAILGVATNGVLTADVVVGGSGTGSTAGVISTDSVNTEDFARKNSGDLILNDIERKVVKIRPMGNPLEQLARYSKRLPAKNRTQQYYSTDVLPVKTKVKEGLADDASNETRINIKTENDDMFSPKETIMFPAVKGYDDNGNVTEQYLQAYILGKDKTGLDIIPCNGKLADGKVCFPKIPVGTEILRAGRAHNETDIQTSRYASVPTKDTQYLQTFRAQVEQSTLQKIADKEADWELSDLEEEAIFDMKRGMNKNFLLGVKSKITDDEGQEVYTTGGIYWMAEKRFIYGAKTEGQFTYDELVKLNEYAFTGSAGNKSKMFFVGSGLMTNLSLIDSDKRLLNVSGSTFVKYGITFKEITTNFGTLWVVHDESFDEAGMKDKGLIIDPAFLRKHVLKELQANTLDLKKTGIRDVDARNICEISGLVLQNPKAHVRVEKHIA